MKALMASGKEYTLYHTTGKVLTSSKNLATTVSATGGGNSQINVRSTTTVHDQIFLMDDTGKEHSFQLQDFDVACREGNEVTVVWAVQKGKKSGDYIAATNHTTNQNFFNIGALRRMYRPSWLIPIILTVVFLYMASGTSILLAFATWIVFIVYTINKANTFKKEFNSSMYS